MPIYTYAIQTYSANVSLQDNSYAFLQLVPPPDYHGGVQPVDMYFFENQPFSAQVVGDNPYTYTYFVVAPNQTLFAGILEMLEQPGTKFVSLELTTDPPIDGSSFDIPIPWVMIGTGSLSVQLGTQQRTIPEKIGKLLRPQQGRVRS